jgi:hypothetical protein
VEIPDNLTTLLENLQLLAESTTFPMIMSVGGNLHGVIKDKEALVWFEMGMRQMWKILCERDDINETV